MDEYNIYKLHEISPENSRAKIELLGKYDPAGIVGIRDPLFVSVAFLKYILCNKKNICTVSKSFLFIYIQI